MARVDKSITLTQTSTSDSVRLAGRSDCEAKHGGDCSLERREGVEVSWPRTHRSLSPPVAPRRTRAGGSSNAVSGSPTITMTTTTGHTSSAQRSVPHNGVVNVRRVPAPPQTARRPTGIPSSPHVAVRHMRPNCQTPTTYFPLFQSLSGRVTPSPVYVTSYPPCPRVSVRTSPLYFYPTVTPPPIAIGPQWVSPQRVSNIVSPYRSTSLPPYPPPSNADSKAAGKRIHIRI